MSGGWNTVESDAGVFTYLLEGLGAKGVQFEELFALDEDDLYRLSPVYGVIFLFKYLSGDDKAGKNSKQPEDGEYDFEAVENMFFAAQTIQNACGTQALLSVLLNQSDKLALGPHLTEFKDFTSGLPSDIRGECLSNSELIRTTHNSFARASPFVDETQRTATGDDDVYHFIAYTPVNGTLYELDGLAPAPISHGPCTLETFPSAVLPVLQRRIARYPTTEIRFNLIAMVQDPRINARAIGDMDTLQAEARKRDAWRWENALRRHNFVGFVGELAKEVTRAKLTAGESEYESWIEGAKARTKSQRETNRKRGIEE
ncbi:ubiquitin carboxyl-terminal hydrolase 2 [Trichodelitschia bisporula]|uniref:Ubiquitin carboxyl-terminal hydrolase n=1 Tax=Trichodelitschia bisporula TaxID=703511 RepID=A0A6G1HKB6_9PEZI|nr:ubiquitin carboxyl-terminal hydrolase 2 [Trichodelitschia bisporula]